MTTSVTCHMLFGFTGFGFDLMEEIYKLEAANT